MVFRKPDVSLIYFVPALAGAGKTHALCSDTKMMVTRQHQKVLFVQSTKGLISQTIDTYFPPDTTRFPVKRFDSDCMPHGGVVTSLTRYLKEPDFGGQVVFTTHAAFERLPFIKSRSEWVLIIDEDLQACRYFCENLSKSHERITKHLKMIPEGSLYGRLIPKNRSALKKIIEEHGNDVLYEVLAPLALDICDPHWNVFVNQASYSRLIKGEKAQFEAFSVRDARLVQGFKKTTIASALFDQSLTYKFWKSQGVRLERLTDFEDRLRYTTHDNGHQIKFHFLIDGMWSKSLRDRLNDSDVTVGRRFEEIVTAFFGDEPFAFMTNKDFEDVFRGLPNAVKLPNTPHGLNQYQGIQNFVCLSALNPPISLSGFFKDQNLTQDEITTAIYRLAVYQAMMRIAIRDPDCKDKVQVVVPDRATAEWLAGLFRGSTIHHLPGLREDLCKETRGRPRNHDEPADSAARQRASRQRKNQALITEIMTLDMESFVDGDFSFALNPCHENTLIGNDVTSIRVPLGTAVDNQYVTHGVAVWGSAVDFLNFLENGCFPERYNKKEDNILMSASIFDPDKEGTTRSRGRENVKLINGIWLDNDGGGISRHEFAQLFPYLQMVIFNTHSSTPERERYRVYIPISCAIPLDAQKMIVNEIKRVLRDNGYASKEEIAEIVARKGKSVLKDHGFDKSKWNAESIFYVPCQAAHPDPSASFFDKYLDEEREPLNVIKWIKNALLNVKDKFEYVTPPESQSSTPLRYKSVNDALAACSVGVPERIEHAVKKFEDAWKGEGHNKFFGLARSLANMGLSDDEMVEVLTNAARNARSPQERLSEIKGIVKEVSKRGTLKQPRKNAKKKVATSTTPLIISIDDLPHAANSVCEFVGAA